jgi:hypothetical protein
MEQRAQRRIYPKDTATWEAATIISRSKALRRQSTWTFSRSRPRRVSSWLVERGATRDTTYGHACTLNNTVHCHLPSAKKKHCHFTSRQPAHDQTHAAAVDVAFRSNATNGRYTRSDRVPLRVAVLFGNSAQVFVLVPSKATERGHLVSDFMRVFICGGIRCMNMISRYLCC